MITRENARVAAKTVENIISIGETIVALLQDAGITREEANKVSEITQKAFQQYVSDKEAHKFTLSPGNVCFSSVLYLTISSLIIEPFEEGDIVTDVLEQCELAQEQQQEAATIIQRAFRIFKQRQDRAKDLLHGMVDWRVAARSTMRLYRKLDVTYEEANRAATLIKAAYKGYYTRRMMNRLLGKTKEIVECCGEHLAYEKEEASFWDQYEKETIEEEKQGIKDEELHVGFTQIQEEAEVLPPSKPITPVSSARSVVSNALDQESIQTDIIKAPVENLDTDVSAFTDTDETNTTDADSEP
ncbi:hypothetical protein RN001_006463 [Aquatica leii]|uniref:Uncharacterized protein n=1 Tax=Aquatica leii TaxID=1421715 RepID=A0AAN7Q1S0_9COLE|nr:hypothetical protein RN001_006463 [Aquatica leii]